MRHPASTYRVQFNASFRFVDALALVPYWQALGITDLYASPFLKAQPGSRHGYDITDHSQLNPEIGTEEDLARLMEALKAQGIGLVMDMVPNHMGIGDASNSWWQDVLENGPSSPCAGSFDIDWTPPKENLINQVLLPILGDQFGKVLESGQLQLLYERGAFRIIYYERRFPVAPHSWMPILERLRHRAGRTVPADHPAMIELESIMTALKHLPSWTEIEGDKIRERQREKEVIKRRLDALVASTPTVAQALQQVVEDVNGRPGDPHSFDALEALIGQQPYRLCYWRVASDEINYRRFFDVNELAAIRVELPEVFQAVHARALDMLQRGWLTGLRIDHPDGLLDPEQYFLDLQAACRRALGDQEQGSGAGEPIVVVEKILSPGERLPSRWAVHGTTGYDFLNLLNGLFVDPAGAEPLQALYDEVTGQGPRVADAIYASKQLTLSALMLSELHVLARRLDRISEQHRWSRDFTLASLQTALGEVIAGFPVYRTYIRAPQGVLSEEDRRHVRAAIRAAKRRNPTIGENIFDFIASVLLLEDPDGLGDADRAQRRDFVMRFQQITGPVMAKGLEDTAFYRVYPLASLNEVGGDPDRFGVAPEEFHRQNAERLQRWSSSLLATATHDTKRGEDLRARLNGLSELPMEWRRAIRRWRSDNQRYLTEVDGAAVPDPNEEYLLYQTLLGSWPLERMDAQSYEDYVQRVEQYMEKALKEAKLHTSWINPNADYDRALKAFVRAILRPGADNGFLRDFRRFHALIARVGMVNGLAQTLLKVGSPGVTDCYQGAELWDLSLVDPDNRRPVDYGRRRRLLAELIRDGSQGRAALAQRLLAQWTDGGIKLFVLRAALRFRRAHAELLLRGDYLPLQVEGPHAGRCCAFARRLGDAWTLVVAPRLAAPMVARGMPIGDSWQSSALVLPDDAPTAWRQVLTDVPVAVSDRRRLPLSAVLRDLPVALLAVQGMSLEPARSPSE